MIPLLSTVCLLSIGLAGFWVLSSTVESWRIQRNLPPGPAGLPLLGNIFQLSPKLQWLQFGVWHERYGSIFSLNMMGQRIIVLNDFKSAADLLDRRANIYSDRPRMIVHGIATGDYLLVTMPYAERWRRMRRAVHEAFNARAVQAYRSQQEQQAVSLTLDLMRDPDNWDHHIDRTIESTIITVVYGSLVNEKTRDRIVGHASDCARRLSRMAAPGAYLVEAIPALNYLPECLASWKTEAKKWFESDSKLFCEYMDNVQESLNRGNDESSFASDLIRNYEKNGLSKIESAWLAGMMLAAGAETTTSIHIAFVLAMILYPNVMKRAQDAIDQVVGRDRMPTFADLDKIPYITAVVKETLRWGAAAPIGVPRRCMQDDWYNGYLIPKGAMIIANSWAMNRDTTYFPDYEDFRPERYLSANGELSDDIPDTHSLGHISFGTGKRVCPGKDLANQSLLINIATMLWACNFEMAVDEVGDVITPSRTNYIDNTITVRHAPFKCCIRARSPEVEQVLSLITSEH